MASVTKTEDEIVAQMEAATLKMKIVKSAVSEVIYGQKDVVEQTLISILGGGHTLLVGAPGLAKTKLAVTLGQVLGLEEKRIQTLIDAALVDQPYRYCNFYWNAYHSKQL